MGHLDLEAEGLSFCHLAIELLAEVLADRLVVRALSFLENPGLRVVQDPSVSYLAGHLVHLVEVHAGWRPVEDHGVPAAPGVVPVLAQALAAWAAVVALGLAAWVAVAAVAVLVVVELEAWVAAVAGEVVEAEQLEVVVA